MSRPYSARIAEASDFFFGAGYQVCASKKTGEPIERGKTMPEIFYGILMLDLFSSLPGHRDAVD
ncbi:MAG: hypothetical protein EBY24_10550 [Betaproteobacteria bacterium]|nr:hypothetical protein [Betaproteobacteria bacterium]